MIEQVPSAGKYHDHQPYRNRNAQCVACTKPCKGVRRISESGRNRTPIGVHHSDTAQQSHRH
ncbi:Uncharacterised protein [Vibrio cholerae]|nr:Uncharacterised protein [Vibrio cholerae]